MTSNVPQPLEIRVLLMGAESVGKTTNGDESTKNYIISHWKTFDCVIMIVDDGGQNTIAQFELVKALFRDEKVNIPLFILANKVDDLEDDDTMQRVISIRHAIEDIFEVSDRIVALQKLLDGPPLDAIEQFTDKDLFPIFIPISALHASILRCASHLTLDQFHSWFELNGIAKFGRERIGRDQWQDLTHDEQIHVTFDMIQDPIRYRKGLSESNFDTFLAALAVVIGGATIQSCLRQSRMEYLLEQLRYESSDIVPSLRNIYKVQMAIEGVTTDRWCTLFKTTFWREFQRIEEAEFLRISSCIDVRFLPCVMEQLIGYHAFVSDKNWTSEKDKALGAMKRVIRRLIGFVVNRCAAGLAKMKQKDDFSVFKGSMNAGIKGVYKRRYLLSSSLSWDQLSPLDWYIIMGSLSLLGGNKYVYENFAKETLIIQQWKFHVLHYSTKLIPPTLRTPRLCCVQSSLVPSLKTNNFPILDAPLVQDDKRFGHSEANAKGCSSFQLPQFTPKFSLGNLKAENPVGKNRKRKNARHSARSMKKFMDKDIVAISKSMESVNLNNDCDWRDLFPVNDEIYGTDYRREILEPPSDRRHFCHIIWMFANYAQTLAEFD